MLLVTRGMSAQCTMFIGCEPKKTILPSGERKYIRNNHELRNQLFK